MAIRAVVAIEQRATAAGESLDPEVQAALRREDLVDHLLATLGDDDPHNRRTAAITLGWLKEPRAERPLIELLGEPALQEYVTHALVSIGFQDRDAYEHGLEHPHDAVRQGTVRCLAWIAPPEGIDLVAPLIHDPSPEVRAEAAAAIGRLGDEDAAMLLFELLGDESELIQESAMGALARMPAARVVPLLLQALSQPGRRRCGSGRGDAGPAARPEHRARPHRALAATRARPCAAPPSRRWARSRRRACPTCCARPSSTRAAWCASRPCSPWAAAGPGDGRRPPAAARRSRPAHALRHRARAGPGAQPATPCRASSRFLADKRKELRFAAVEALGADPRRGGGAAADAVLGDADRNLRRAAAESLGNIGDPQAVPPLLLALEDEHWSVRCAAATALGRIRSTKATPALLARLTDEDATVRRAAVAALGEVGDARAAGAARAGCCRDPGLQSTALEALRRMGVPPCPRSSGPSPRAAPDVRRLLVDLVGQARGPPRAPQAPAAALADDSAQVRAEAALALGDGGFLDAVRPLMDLKAKDPSPEARQAAAGALKKLSPLAWLPGSVPGPPTTMSSSARRSSVSSATSSTRIRPLLRRKPARARCARGCRAAWPASTWCSFEDYYHYLRFGPERAEELQRMVSHLTNNETYFYRELPQLQVFAETRAAARQGAQERRPATARCASCRRAAPRARRRYTLAMILYDSGQFFWNWDVEVIGLDVDQVGARQGEAGPSTTTTRSAAMSPELQERHFVKQGRRRRPGEGADPPAGAASARATSWSRRATRACRPLDVIFCRNVLIYFSDATILRAVRFPRAWCPGGYLSSATRSRSRGSPTSSRPSASRARWSTRSRQAAPASPRQRRDPRAGGRRLRVRAAGAVAHARPPPTSRWWARPSTAGTASRRCWRCAPTW